MNVEQIQIVAVIDSLDLTAEADAGEFESIAAMVNAQTITEHNETPVSMAATLAALGTDADAVIVAFESTPTGRAGLAKLAAKGLDYGHPLTLRQLAAMVDAGGITQQIADTLTTLSSPMQSPAQRYGISTPLTAAVMADAWSRELRNRRQRCRHAPPCFRG